MRVSIRLGSLVRRAIGVAVVSALVTGFVMTAHQAGNPPNPTPATSAVRVAVCDSK
jgi:hypothetical protein